MKKIIKPFKIILPLLMLAQLSVFAQNNDNNNRKKYEFVKNKKISKSYNVSSSDKLDIQNSFGSVKITTWNRNEIKVDVDIEVSANTNALAQKILDGISIVDEKSGKGISFKTSLKETVKSVGDKGSMSMNTRDINYSNGDKSNMSVNYSISMPATNPLAIKNEFGSTILPDYRGDVELTSTFGELITGNLPNVKSIQVEFGNAKFQNLTDGLVTIKYSEAEFGKLSGSVKLNLEFCSSVRMGLDNNLSSLDLKTSYSTVNLKPLGSLQASYNISTSFGSFKNTSDVKFTNGKDEKNDRGPKFDSEYSGKSGSGTVPVKVKSSFGKIIFGEASEEDMKDKNKTKTKTRTS